MSTPPLAFSNFASARLAQAVTPADTVVTVEAGGGVLFPPVTAVGQDQAVVVMEDANGNKEVCHLTSVTGDLLTLVRAQENTIAQSFAVDSRIELRVTAGVLEEIDCGTF